jgi:hypothetical protein
MSDESKDSIREIFSAASGQLSSKRIVGVLAWLVVLVVYAVCAITERETPDGMGEIILGASSLLGVDSVAQAFKKDK